LKKTLSLSIILLCVTHPALLELQYLYIPKSHFSCWRDVCYFMWTTT